MQPIISSIGEDSHQFTPNKKLIIAGVEISEVDYGFQGNSDGDVVLHSICNCFDLVCDCGSIGNYADQMLVQKDIKDSSKYLDYVIQIAKHKGWQPHSVSVSIQGSKPKLEPYHAIFKQKLGQLLGVSKKKVGLTFTSGESLTAFGRGQGLKAITIVNFCRLA
ncbi:MAG: 2-C-methyl-D-erythritol 2,4-cyclodiphosphate synthase [Candidatus Moranbacteria bacterium]|nr:2-C-methyl-D-erythritol 2,4-cyclodiphosphate synthase [Candidatus Moranbacteria bacterium]